MPFVSETLAQFVYRLRYEDVPAAVREHSEELMLDAVGISFTSGKFEFADKALSSVFFRGR